MYETRRDVAILRARMVNENLQNALEIPEMALGPCADYRLYLILLEVCF